MYDDDVVRLDLPSFPTRRSSDLENLPVELWSMSVPGAPRRTVRTIAAHIHNTRCMWIKMIGASHGVAVPRNVNARTVKPGELTRALARSSEGMIQLIRLGVTRSEERREGKE